jgi:RNA polymerase sigma-70 factor (ECF subfamily)
MNADVMYEEHRQPVFRYLCRLVGGSDAATDLTQEVFLRVTRGGVPPADSAGQRAWVFRIARNLALNHLRDRQRRPVSVPIVDGTGPATQELRLAIDQALGRLADVDRDVFLMRESAGLSYQEIAGACELTIEAVRARLHRARLQLRTDLEREITAQRIHGVQYARSDHDD